MYELLKKFFKALFGGGLKPDNRGPDEYMADILAEIDKFLEGDAYVSMTTYNKYAAELYSFEMEEMITNDMFVELSDKLFEKMDPVERAELEPEEEEEFEYEFDMDVEFGTKELLDTFIKEIALDLPLEELEIKFYKLDKLHEAGKVSKEEYDESVRKISENPKILERMLSPEE